MNPYDMTTQVNTGNIPLQTIQILHCEGFAVTSSIQEYSITPEQVISVASLVAWVQFCQVPENAVPLAHSLAYFWMQNRGDYLLEYTM